MEKAKSFLRFVINDNGNGEITGMTTVIKIFDDKDKFIRMDGGYIYATGTQIEVDIEERDSSKYTPMNHFKHVAGKIVKKSSAKIQQADNAYQQAKQAKQQELQQKEQEITAVKNVVLDESKTAEERIGAVADLIRKGVI